MPRLSALLALLLVFTATAGCDIGEPDEDDDPGADEPAPPAAEGLAYAASDQSAGATFADVVAALEAAAPVSIVARVNHAENAEEAGLELRPTRVVLFGNPRLGTPLMQADPTAGIDLPQKILVHRGPGGEVYASYNTPDYLAARHDVGDVETLGQIGSALQTFTTNATGAGAIEQIAPDDVEDGEGLVQVESAFSVDSTIARLENAIEAAGPISVMATLDHAANAESVGMELRPTRLLVFGNPQLGTPLMQRAQSIGIDLPQKVLVYEDAEGTVRLAYNDPSYLAARHGIEGQEDVLSQIQSALEGLAQTATQEAGAE